MTFKLGNVIVFCPEPDDICQECGDISETRAYGENGKRICFGCGMKNPEETEKRMYAALFGDSKND